MASLIYKYALLNLAANCLTAPFALAAGYGVPPCPLKTKAVFLPDSTQPLWSGCKDEAGNYQGVILQYTRQGEIIRIASVKDSLRNGVEFRFGANSSLEERSFHSGHLQGASYIFASDSTLGKVLPKTLDAGFWSGLAATSPVSKLQAWLKTTPTSTLDFENGRLTRLRFANKDYHFQISKDARIFALDHPEMKKGFFIDPEPLWLLSPADLKAALLPGFGSCKKYAGPIGRFTRNFDHMMFKREVNEKKFDESLAEIRTRFLEFCVPKDLREHLGVMECPPPLPSPFASSRCLLPISDQLRVPYLPKYFSFEETLGHSPEETHLFFAQKGMKDFLNEYANVESLLTLTPKASVQIKRGGNGNRFRLLENDAQGHIKIKRDSGGDKSTDWWEWHRVPGF